MSEIGAVAGFFILEALLWSRISAERRQAERESGSAPKTSSDMPAVATGGGTSNPHRG
jgi:hypothetical protein